MVRLRLYNTLKRFAQDSYDEFDSDRERFVGLYTCGPTVYNYQHVGNYRTYVFEDVLKRTLESFGFEVRHVMNITDVGHLTDDADEGEDKLEVGARREGKTAWEIARFYESAFLEDIRKLNIDFKQVANPARENKKEAVDILCRATEHIEEQQEMVRRLIDKGFTYETGDGIYFDTSKFPGYGEMVGTENLAGIQEGTRVSMGDKRNPTDFAIWKFSPGDPQRQMEWDFLGRKGFPGWHIECSAMGRTYLGDTFDIHCGGVDHVPIHHTNEIAQAEAATGRKPFVRVWMHAEFLVFQKAKMAKSADGFIRLADLEGKGFHPLDYRYFCFGAHYRKQLDFSWEGLQAAKTARRRLKDKIKKLTEAGAETAGDDATSSFEEWVEKFNKCLENDLCMPAALAIVYDALDGLSLRGDKIQFVKEVEKVLALGLFDEEKEESLPEDLRKIFDDYAAARKEKDFAASDKLRVQLKERGIQVLDSKAGSSWRRI